ncbi:hypothetical protein SSX86_010849 [Deinandra increscens subsp. villosa]|uniref:RRM domain-containing protein n=1 Tax=Deinandra increscens subsp. villosa TaxID=3103831 RepID=A0AAP0DCT1_9ASTR
MLPMEREKVGGERKPKEYDWEPARRRKRNQNKGNFNGNYGNSSPHLTIFYITNFPDDCSISDLKGVFNEHGIVSDVYISRRCNWDGERFGFVKFLRVDNKELLEKNLCNIKIGNRKLHANLERIDKDGNKVFSGRPNNYSGQQWVPKGSQNNITAAGFQAGGRSFRDVVGGVSSATKEKVIFINHPMSEACEKWNNTSLLGRVKDLDTLINLNSILKGLEVKCKVRFLGGLNTLLSFDSTCDKEGFLGHASVWGICFSKLEVWEGQFVPFERIANLQIIGLPAHLWGSELFNQVGALFGKVLKGSEADVNDLNLTGSRVIVLSNGHNPIFDNVIISCMGKRFRVWVREQIGWMPWEAEVGEKEHIGEEKPEDIRGTSGEVDGRTPVASEMKANDDILEEGEISMEEAAVGEPEIADKRVEGELPLSPSDLNFGPAQFPATVGPSVTPLVNLDQAQSQANLNTPISGPAMSMVGSNKKRPNYKSPSVSPIEDQSLPDIATPGGGRFRKIGRGKWVSSETVSDSVQQARPIDSGGEAFLDIDEVDETVNTALNMGFNITRDQVVMAMQGEGVKNNS